MSTSKLAPGGRWFRWFWLGWAVVLIAGFAVVEYVALAGVRQSNDTLSDNVRRLITKNGRWLPWLSLIGWGVLITWLTAHWWDF